MPVDAGRPSAQRPLGNDGPPGLGETLAFTRDPFGFVRERRERYGRVFRTNLLGRTTVILCGPQALAAFYDPENVMRDGANPPNVQTLFGGTGVINNLDGDVHMTRKQFVSAALSRDAIESYMPTMTRRMDAAFASWTQADEIRWNDEIKQFTLETLGAVFTSIVADAELRALVKRCEAVAIASTALPIPLPGTAYTKGVHAKDQSLAYYRELVRAHRRRRYDDGLSRMLAARSTEGAALTDDVAAGELQHLFLAGYVMFAQLVGTVLQLTAHPDVRQRLVQETASLSETPSAADVVAVQYLMQVVNEVRRLTPIVPVVFGKARRAFVADGFEIPAGWAVAAAVWQHDREAATFPNPERFDPERFGARNEGMHNAYAYAPQGAGPPDGHRCPGFDLTTIFMGLFASRLVRGHTWVLPEQDLSLNWRVIPPTPKDGLRAAVRRVP
jgi:cytochrome P450